MFRHTSAIELYENEDDYGGPEEREQDDEDGVTRGVIAKAALGRRRRRCRRVVDARRCVGAITQPTEYSREVFLAAIRVSGVV